MGGCLAAAAAGALVYLNSLGNGFALDDIPLVRDDPRIRSFRALPGLFLEPYRYDEGAATGLYRPIANVCFGVNRLVLGPDPWGFHLVNVLAHGIVSALAVLAFRAAGAGPLGSLAAGLLFAVHPIHTEAVANVAGRAELLAAGGALGSYLAHVRARNSHRGSRRFLFSMAAAGLYLASILSKETAVLAPAVFAWDDVHGRRRSGRTGKGSTVPWVRYAGYPIAFGVGMLLRIRALGGLRGAESTIVLDNPAAFEATPWRIATAAWVLVRYAGILCWPARLCSDYSFDAVPVVRSSLDPRLWAGAGFLALLVGSLVLGRKLPRPIAFGSASFFLFFLPASNLLFPAGVLMAERLAYLPSVGACLVGGEVFSRLAGEAASSGGGDRIRRRAVLIVGGLLLAILGARTWVRNPVWKDNATLALNDVEILPRSAKLQAGAGIVLHEQGRFEEAEKRYRTAVSIYPDYAQIHYNLGVLLAGRGRRIEAAGETARAAALAPSNPRPERLARQLFEAAAPGETSAIARALLAEPRLPPSLRKLAEKQLASLGSEGDLP
jgi:hypothetical protein